MGESAWENHYESRLGARCRIFSGYPRRTLPYSRPVATSSTSQGRIVYDSPYHQLTDCGPYLRLQRTALGYEDLSALEAEYQTLVAAQLSVRPRTGTTKGLLVDLRAATGRNDPGFERVMDAWRKKSLLGFAPLVVLVRSALGKLHVQRHMRADGLDATVLNDPERAARLAASPPPHT